MIDEFDRLMEELATLEDAADAVANRLLCFEHHKRKRTGERKPCGSK